MEKILVGGGLIVVALVCSLVVLSILYLRLHDRVNELEQRQTCMEFIHPTFDITQYHYAVRRNNNDWDAEKEFEIIIEKESDDNDR